MHILCHKCSTSLKPYCVHVCCVDIDCDVGLEQGCSLELSSERGSLLLEDVDTLRDGLALVGLGDSVASV